MKLRVADLERPEGQQHHAGREAAERSGKRHTHGKADAGQHRGKAGRLETEDSQHGQQTEQQDGPANRAAEELGERDVELGPLEATSRDPSCPSGRSPHDHQEDQRLGDTDHPAHDGGL